MANRQKWVYFFGDGKAEGKGDQKDLLGGKGAGLAEMTRIGLPVPGGFTITTEACASYYKLGRNWPAGLEKEVRLHIAKLERACDKKLGAARDPLLVSVRSGAARSMPGMMETILNLGLNDDSVEGLARTSSNRRFAFDAYRRLIMMYGSTAMGMARAKFDEAFDRLKETRTASRLGRKPGDRVLDTDVDADEMEHLIGEFKRIYRSDCGEDFPQEPFKQLKGAIDAVLQSWMADKAVTYRRVENITGLAGTAVNVCQMVYGNMGDDSGTGVCFTRDPSTGEATYYGDVLINAQGEDVVAGVRDPLHLDELQSLMPEVYDQLEAVRVMLELHYKEMQDLEFTIERGKLYILQCRVGKRSPRAAFRIAVEQATKGLISSTEARRLAKTGLLPAKYVAAAAKPVITRDDAIQRIEASNIERLFYPILDSGLDSDTLNDRKIAEGIGAVPGAACGEVVFTAEDAEARAAGGAEVILVRKETSPEDVGGMYAASGVLTVTGGKTSHAAVVARGWGKCCIVGCSALKIDYDEKAMRFNGRVIREGDVITLDGATGRVFEGEIRLERPEPPPEYETLMEWCDKRRRLRVRANADTPADAAKAVELGAEGIGLCRTEHMFFDPSQPQRLRAMREMILADNDDARRKALAKIEPFQVSDFEGIFTKMDGKPVTIRLLDPPLHEFLPHEHDSAAGQEIADELAGDSGFSEEGGDWSGRERGHEPGGGVCVADAGTKTVTAEGVRRRVEELRETNPMLGHRGCRLCITYPAILETQVRAIVEAAVNCTERGVKVIPEIMIPLSIEPKELALLVGKTRIIADAILKRRKCGLKYLVGTMVETPRAALLAGPMAEVADFFSFGTNDLTQLTMGLSRDDAGRFLPDYLTPPKERGWKSVDDGGSDALLDLETPILPSDPFQTLDEAGVGLLVELASREGRAHKKNVKLGICGEHGGDPASIRFCESVKLDYVSCSPFRVPIARLAAAQAVIATFRTAAQSSKTSARASRPTSSTKSRSAAKSVARRTKTAKKSASSVRTRGPAAKSRKKPVRAGSTRAKGRSTSKKRKTR